MSCSFHNYIHVSRCIKVWTIVQIFIKLKKKIMKFSIRKNKAQANLDLKNSNFLFWNWELFALRKIHVLTLKTSCLKKNTTCRWIFKLRSFFNQEFTVWQSVHCNTVAAVVADLALICHWWPRHFTEVVMASKSWKQILKFSFEQKNEQKYFCPSYEKTL